MTELTNTPNSENIGAARSVGNGTKGRVYGGDPNLVHVPDGRRTAGGKEIANVSDAFVRGSSLLHEIGVNPDDYETQFQLSEAVSGALPVETFNKIVDETTAKKLCPGCYMILLFNAAVELAKKSGQPLTELGNTMAAAFSKLAETAIDNGKPYVFTEEINVILDPRE